MSTRIIQALLCLTLLSGIAPSLWAAQEIILIFTGETHAMLYPCNCPIEPDGGVARRAAMIKQLRASNRNVLVVDSGGFFAGGLMDEYSQNTELDRLRTAVQVKAMSAMAYDAAAIADDEFNFGADFFSRMVSEASFPFVSANIPAQGPDLHGIKPFVIKRAGGLNIGIIGITGLFAQKKIPGISLEEPAAALQRTIKEVRAHGAEIIILLSHQGESEDLKLIEEVEGIDILVIGHSRMKEEISTKIRDTLILRPSWQGRRLGVLSFQVSDGKVSEYKATELRLSDKVFDDQTVKNFLPRCFSSVNCKLENSVGTCLNPGTMQAECRFSQASRVEVTVVVPRSCVTCDTAKTLSNIKHHIPGAAATYLYYPEPGTEKLLKELGINTLPAYLLDATAEKEEGFAALQDNLQKRGKFYFVNPRFSGFSYFAFRDRIKGRIDLFISLLDKDTDKVLEVTRPFNPEVHFLTVEGEGADAGMFSAIHGKGEVEECLRSVCVQKYYPEAFFDYLICRAKHKDSSWWEDCLAAEQLQPIRMCARGDEARRLLRENIGLNKELGVMFGPTFLIENQEIFATQGAPTKEQLSKILRR